MKLHRIFRRWGWILFIIAIPSLWELLLLFAPRDARRHLRPYLHCVQAVAFAGFGYWLLEPGLRLRRMQQRSFWHKSWPGPLILGIGIIVGSVDALIYLIGGPLLASASERRLFLCCGCVGALAFPALGYWLIDEALRLRRKETGSIWRKSWPASLILGLATFPVSIMFLIWNLTELLAKH
jgi:hypothetical protein